MTDSAARSPLDWAGVEDLVLRALSIQSELNRLMLNQGKLRPEDIANLKEALDLLNKEALQILDISRDLGYACPQAPPVHDSTAYHLWDLAHTLRTANVDYLYILRTAPEDKSQAEHTGPDSTQAICVLIQRFGRYIHDCAQDFNEDLEETLLERIGREVERRVSQLRTAPPANTSDRLLGQFNARMDNFVKIQKKAWAEERQYMELRFKREVENFGRASAKAQMVAEIRRQAEREEWMAEIRRTKKQIEGAMGGSDAAVPAGVGSKTASCLTGSALDQDQDPLKSCDPNKPSKTRSPATLNFEWAQAFEALSSRDITYDPAADPSESSWATISTPSQTDKG